MNSWNEDNFLERLELPAGRADCIHNGRQFQLVIGEVNPTQGELHHLRICSDCSDLSERLRRFHEPASFADEIEWQQIGQRLEIWLDGLLNTRQMPASGGESRRRVLRGALFSWRAQFVFAFCFVLALCIGVFWGTWMQRTRNQEVAANRPDPASAPVTAPVISEPLSVPAQSKPKKVGQPRRISPAVAPPPIVTPAPANSQVADRSPERNKASEAVSLALPTLPNKEVQATQSASTAPAATSASARPERAPIQMASRGSPGRTSAHAIARNTPAVLAMRAPTNRSTRPLLPAFVQLPAGARIWVFIKSVDPKNDGFDFVGSVMLPVTEGATTMLNRGTGVSGSGKTDISGRTSLRITDLTIGGTEYRLREVNPSGNPPSGLGTTVLFDAGRVLEVWMQALSIYDRIFSPASVAESIETGQTMEQVLAILGQPKTTATIGMKVIYVYSNLKITFIDGRVVSKE